MRMRSAAPAAPSFLEDRPDLREPRPWHPLAHIARALPATLERLAPDLALPAGGRVIDYGCADVPYRRLFASDADFVPADLPGNPRAAVQIRSDGTLPVPDEDFDALLSTQVLEHVNDPQLYLSECFRVLRPGGRMLLSTHGIMVHHADPVDYWRWTSEGLDRVVREAGFEVLRFEGIMGLAATGLQLVQDAVYYRLPRVPRAALALLLQALIALADRLETSESRRVNALVFALVARKP